MTLLYHGTGVSEAFDIAKSGAILSPMAQRLKKMQEFPLDADNLRRIYPDRSDEEIATIVESEFYGSGEIEHRVRRVSLVREKSRAVVHAKNLFEGFRGGVILELEVSDEEITNKDLLKGKSSIVYWLSHIELERLRALHLLPVASLLEYELRQAFSRYNPIINHVNSNNGGDEK